MTDILSLVLRDRYGCWGFVDLWRYEGSPPFSDAERDLAFARDLGVSEYTVQQHIKAIFTKSDTSSRAEVVARACGSAAG